MKIGAREIGRGNPVYIIGEVGCAHDGSVNRAHEFIDAIADAGASAVKFQCHTEIDQNEEWRAKPAYEKYNEESRYAYRRRVQFTQAAYASLAAHCRDRQVDFLCSPFSMEAFRIIDPLVPAWKVPSGQITNHEMLAAMAETRKPILISTGMATNDEIYQAGRVIGLRPHIFLQCTSRYPCPAGDVGLGNLKGLNDDGPCGLSDHSGTIYAGLAAVAMGASVVEVHVKLSKYETGPDASSSITPDKLKQLVEGAAFIREALRPINKDVMASMMERTRSLFLHKESK